MIIIIGMNQIRELLIMMAEKDEELEKLIKDNMELKKVGKKIV